MKEILETLRREATERQDATVVNNDPVGYRYYDGIKAALWTLNQIGLDRLNEFLERVEKAARFPERDERVRAFLRGKLDILNKIKEEAR